MPIFEFHQPRHPMALDDPSRWAFQMRPPDIDGWPASPLPIPIIGNPIYFECDPIWLENACINLALKWNPLRAGEPFQKDIDACVLANFDQCVNVLTEDMPYQDGWVQVQACNESVSCSPWSKPLVVPELPSVATSVFVGVMLLALIFKTTSKGNI